MDRAASSPEALHKRAVAMMVAGGPVPLDVVGSAAADLLTEPYAVGVSHGMSPDDWEAVTSLPLACLDVRRAQARRQRLNYVWAATIADVQPPPPPAVQSLCAVDRPRPGRAR